METIAPLLDGKFKDADPTKTVERIIDILHANGVELEETWRDSGVPYCYAMSVKIVGGKLKSNGKGLSREFARASGYAELMERLQMGFTGNPDAQKDGDFGTDDGKYDMLTVEQLLQESRPMYEVFSKRLFDVTGVRMTPEDIVGQYVNEKGLVSSTAYCNAKTGKKVYLPTVLRKRVYTTTGCAAGNTIEEAIVQAISEIVERNHQLRAINENMTLPDVPENVLKQYEAAYEIISFVRNHGYKVVVKDCSLGTKFPVVCVCIINQRTGRYHTHFGAYPIFEIALQRSLTESFQGHTINDIGMFDDFLYSTNDAAARSNLVLELTQGTGIKTVEFFVGKPTFSYNETVGFNGSSNRELLKECIEFFDEQGFDVLVRDRSCLGFPTVQVLIPGYSETQANRICKNLDEHRYSAYAYKALRNPAASGIQDYLGLLMHLEEMNKIKTRAAGYHGFLAGTKLAAQLTYAEQDNLLNASIAYVYYAMARYKDAIACINKIIPTTNADNLDFLICLKRYLKLKLNGISQEKIDDTLRYFHSEQAVNDLYGYVRNGKNPFDRFVLHCDTSCTPACSLYGVCYQKFATQLADLLTAKAKELNFEEFSKKLLELQDI